MVNYSIILEMIKYGFILSLIYGVIYLIYWAIKKNVKYLIDKFGNKELIEWIIDGLKKGYTEEQLSSILMDKEYKINKILKYLMKAKKLIKKEKLKRDNRKLKLENLDYLKGGK